MNDTATEREVMEYDVIIVGAGPAGLACAHRLAMHGHRVTVFEAKPKAGGLNEYGIAAYKMLGGFAQAEVDLLLTTNQPYRPRRT